MNNLKLFLSYASEDKEIAWEIANELQNNGIETFFDEWSIGTGKSIRQSIDQGISECTHFMVLLTQASIKKEWVNAELDAGFSRMLHGKCNFLPIRYKLDAKALPPILSGRLAPELDITSLINEIHGVPKKPPLGNAPIASKVKPISGLSKAASSIVQMIVKRSKLGGLRDPFLASDEIMSLLDLSEPDYELALHDLSQFVKPKLVLMAPSYGIGIWPKDELFVKFDPFFMGWNPNSDAVKAASTMVNNRGSMMAKALCEALNWEPRRLNPALTVLIMQGAVLAAQGSKRVFVALQINKNQNTLAFIRDNE